MEQARRITELEKSDLIKAYRTVVEERYIFENGNEKLRRTLELMTRQKENLEIEKTKLYAKLTEMDNEIKHRVANMSSFDRQLDSISRENQHMQRRLEAAEAENRRLKVDLENCRESGKQISHVSHELQINAAKLKEEKTCVVSQLKTTSQERDVLQKLLSEEHHRSQGLEQVIASIRAKELAAASQLKSLAKANASLTTKVNEANSKLLDTQLMLGSATLKSPNSSSKTLDIHSINSSDVHDSKGSKLSMLYDGNVGKVAISESSESPCEKGLSSLSDYLSIEC